MVVSKVGVLVGWWVELSVQKKVEPMVVMTVEYSADKWVGLMAEKKVENWAPWKAALTVGGWVPMTAVWMVDVWVVSKEWHLVGKTAMRLVVLMVVMTAATTVV